MPRPNFIVEDYVGENNIELIRTSEGETYVRTNGKNHPTNSMAVHDMMAYAYKSLNGVFPKKAEIKEYVNQVEILARAQENESQLHLRVARDGEYIYYDLGNAVVKIGPAGWELVTNVPVYFKKYGNTADQVQPVAGEINLADVLQFVKLNDRDDELLFIVYLVSCFIPGIAHPIPAFYGEKGAAKSTAMRVLRNLVDPAHQELMTLPGSARDLTLVLSHNYMPAFDNMSKLTTAVSDILCCAATGGSMQRRKLYTDADDVIIPFKSCVTINGINLMTTKSDLADRAILFEGDRVDENQRQTEKELWGIFEEKKPLLLGKIFDVLVGTMRVMQSDLQIANLPRMADFATWGYAIAEAASIGGEAFLTAYRKNIAKASAEVIAEDPVADAIINFMGDKGDWSGYATPLLATLTGQNPTYALPKMSNGLSKRIKEVTSNLRVKGIDCTFVKDTAHNQTMIILRNRNFIPAIPAIASVAVATDTALVGDIDETGDTGDIGDGEMPVILERSGISGLPEMPAMPGMN